MSYFQLLQRLFSINLSRGVKLGLTNAIRLNEALGFPDRQFPSVHVAGTNGKGSVCTKIARVLEIAGYRVGLYTSPHLHSFRERIMINQKPIAERAVERLLPSLFALAEQGRIPATFFELTTLLAFQYFAQEKIDIAIIETGLGGRLDATNIITPILSIITSIGLEHTDVLGQTTEKIAKEKGGIIKSHIPVVIGPQARKKAIFQIAKEKQCDVLEIKTPFHNVDQENVAIAKAALTKLKQGFPFPPHALEEGLRFRPPCRMQVLTQQELPKWKGKPFPEALILDVAHNPPALKRFFLEVKKKYPQKTLRVIFGLSKDKETDSCLKLLKEHTENIHLIEAPNGRGMTTKELYHNLIKLGMPHQHLFIKKNLSESALLAIEEAAKKQQIVVACGTFFIMSVLLDALGIKTEADPFNLIPRSGQF